MVNNRILSFLVDMIIISIVFSILPFGLEKRIGEFTLFELKFFVNLEFKIFMILVYFLMFDLLNQGKTIGKIFFKIKSVDTTTDAFVLKQALIRSLLKMISIIILPISLILLLNNSYSIHEFFSKTKTIRNS
jgi:uncharacterized RDD family membrane protein YckC